MAKLLYKLHGVPEDEADDIRELMASHHIDFYETSAGRWGISVAAIWIRDNDDFPHAKSLLDDYHRQRFQRAREDWERQLAEGSADTFLFRFRRHPLRMLVFILAIIVIGYLTLAPFLHWAMQ